MPFLLNPNLIKCFSKLLENDYNTHLSWSVHSATFKWQSNFKETKIKKKKKNLTLGGEVVINCSLSCSLSAGNRAVRCRRWRCTTIIGCCWKCWDHATGFKREDQAQLFMFCNDKDIIVQKYLNWLYMIKKLTI